MYLANAAQSTIDGDLDATASMVDVQSGEGANFPTLVPCVATLGAPDAAHEDVYVTGLSGDTVTMIRGVLSAPREWPDGTPIQLMPADLWGIAAIKTTASAAQPRILVANAAVALAAADTIATADLDVSRVTPGALCTGVILEAGTADGQRIYVENTDDTNTVTFDDVGTSNVADGATDIIAALSIACFIWNDDASYWARVASV